MARVDKYSCKIRVGLQTWLGLKGQTKARAAGGATSSRQTTRDTMGVGEATMRDGGMGAGVK